MSSVVVAPAQRLTKSWRSAAAVKFVQLTALASATGVTKVSETNYTVDTNAHLAAVATLATGGITTTANETLNDLGKTLTFTSDEDGAVVRFARVQRKARANNTTGYVCISSEVSVGDALVARA
jgi:hypothetical protein